MNYAPIARIVVRYAVGGVIGFDAADIIAGDPEVMSMIAIAIGAATEGLYALAVKNGWAK